MRAWSIAAVLLLAPALGFAAPAVIPAKEARACIQKAVAAKFKRSRVTITLGAASSRVGDLTLAFSIARKGRAPALTGLIDVATASSRKGARRVLELHPDDTTPILANN